MSNAEDAKFISQALKGEEKAFVELLNKYKNRIYSFLLRTVQNPADAEDLAQITFIKAFKNLSQYDNKHPFFSWLYRIAHNAAMDFFRKKDPNTLSIDDENAHIEISGRPDETEHAAEININSEILEKAIAKLSPLHREIILLRHSENLEYEQIADMLNISASSVKIRLFRARQMLREKLLQKDLV